MVLVAAFSKNKVCIGYGFGFSKMYMLFFCMCMCGYGFDNPLSIHVLYIELNDYFHNMKYYIITMVEDKQNTIMGSSNKIFTTSN